MASLSNAKVLGGVGAILALFPVISVIGWILILVALKEISDSTQDKTVFDDGIIAGITAIIGAVTVVVFFATGAFGGFINYSLGLTTNFGLGGVFGALAIFAIFYALVIISAIFLKRAYDKTAQHLKVGAFATTGLLYLIGALTSIIVVGFLIFFIAFIFQIIAYFSIQDQPPPPAYYGFPPPQPMPVPTPMIVQPPATPAQPASVPTQPSTPEFKYCYRCGTKLSFIATYCTNCGTKQ